jgi:hypothetical protein
VVVLTGHTRTAGWKFCPSATLSATDVTSTGLGSNLGSRGKRRTTSYLKEFFLINHKYMRDSVTCAAAFRSYRFVI